MKVLLVQPAWPRPAKIKDPDKYLPWPLLKLAAYHRSLGREISLVRGKVLQKEAPNLIEITTVFSWWFSVVEETVSFYRMWYPQAQIRIGGVHASYDPELYKKAFPYAEIFIGKHKEAETLQPAWDLVDTDTQIISFSEGCNRSCSFCYMWRDWNSQTKTLERIPWVNHSFDEIAPSIIKNRLILNDANFIASPHCDDILEKLSHLKINGRSISSIEIQGGLDARLLSKKPHLPALLKKAKVRNVRLAWDGSMKFKEDVRLSLFYLERAGYKPMDLRIFVLYNHEVPFEESMEKLKIFEAWGVAPIHSRFRPITETRDGYCPQKRQQSEHEYYIHEGWTDSSVRAFGGYASKIGKMVRARLGSVSDWLMVAKGEGHKVRNIANQFRLDAA